MEISVLPEAGRSETQGITRLDINGETLKLEEAVVSIIPRNPTM